MPSKRGGQGKPPHRLVLGKILSTDSLKSLKTTSLQKGMSDFCARPLEFAYAHSLCADILFL